ncbi:MAG TPA: PIN domain-containing protein [Solirubrobacterales bacterium]|nr:PIN domain-containing protein [Solirubrobacterales bacterium]
MIILDASVLIGHLDGRDQHHERARELLTANAAAPLGASSISLAETLVGPARLGKVEVARGALDRLAIEEVSLGADASVRLALIRAETGLKLPDCCVLLAAKDRNGAVASFDLDLVAHARDRGLAVA